MSALFISDLHIDESRPAVLAGFKRLLDTETADAVYILGDLAEVWIGDDDDGATATEIREALIPASRRRPLYVMRGNRDFLFGAQFATDTGVVLLEDPSVIDVDGEAVLVAHGDSYCTADTEYQHARVALRSAAWQAGVLATPLDQRRTLAATLRAKSIAANANKASNITDVTTAAIDTAMDAAGVSLMVHGHTHRPGIHDLGGGRRRIVLGDWNRCGWKLLLNQGDAALSCFPLQATPP